MAISMARALTGAKALSIKPSSSNRAKVANGSKWTMKRKDSFMVEVQVGEDESEDVAVRNFMKSVMQSGVIDSLRARRTKETKIMEYKRKLQARAMARRLGILEPTWEELYGQDTEAKAFDDFFVHDEDGEDFIDALDNANMGDLNMLMPQLNASGNMPAYAQNDDEIFDLGTYESQQGGYLPTANTQGGYMAQGGYMDAQPQGSNGYQQ